MSSKARKKPSQRGGAGPVAFFVALFIVALGTIQLASTFHTYALNLAELNGLKKQEAALVAQKRELENDIARWDDKAYVTAQARDRLGFVFPGEQAIRVENPEAVTGKGGRILTDEFCRVKNQSNIFAIGDIAQQNEPAYPNGHPQVAQVALQQGKLLARNLCLLEHHQPPLPFHYRDKGTLATVGRNKAVADLPHLKTQGFVAWFLWMAVHLRSILGVRNRLEILLNWFWNYLTYDQAIRLIFKTKRTPPDDTDSSS